MPRTKHELMRADIPLDRSSGVPLDRQIADGIIKAIEEGFLRPGDNLMPIRRIAAALGVARATVDAAYALLVSEGYIQTARSRGSFVSVDLPVHALLEKTTEKRPAAVKPVSSHAALLTSAIIELMPQKNIPLAIVGTSPDASPGKDFAAILSRITRRSLLQIVYSHPSGLNELKTEICRIAGRLRGVRARPEQVIVTSGSQLGLTLTLMALFNAGDEVLLEDPGYPLLHGTAELFGLKPVWTPIDAEGLDLRAGLKAATNPRGVYLTPSHQCPLGMMMSLKRRREVLDWAEQSGAWVIEDDYDSELRYGGNLPYPSLQDMDTGENVIYVGTFSKVLFPGLRLGYLIVPEKLTDLFSGLRLLIDRQGQELVQGAVAQFIREGYYEPHLRHMRQIFEERRTYLLAACRREFGDWGEFSTGEQGMHVVFNFHNQDIDDAAVQKLCLEEGVETRHLSSFYHQHAPRKGLVLGFGFFTESQILAAVSRIGYVLRHNFAAWGPQTKASDCAS